MLFHGVDIIEIARVRKAVERWGDRFLHRVFTPTELADCGVDDGRPRFESLAARWAAKEAAAKALGCGLAGLAVRAGPYLGWHELEVVRAPSGQPTLRFHGAAADHADAAVFTLSLAHSDQHAIASVVGMKVAYEDRN